MDLKHLSCFLAVAEHKNFTVVAKKLHYSVSTVTQYIRMLEEELGFELFNRASRPLALTEAGKYFYEQTMEIPARMDRIVENSKKIALKKPGRKIIGFVVEDVSLLDVVEKYFRDTYPEHLIAFHQYSVNGIEEVLLKGKCDAFFIRTNPEFSHKQLVQKELFKTRLCCRVAKKHPLAGKDVIRFSDLSRETVVIMPTGTHSQQQSFEMNYYDFCPDISVYAFENFSAADAFSKARDGILLCYEHMIKSTLTSDYAVIEFEVPNENSYSLITRVEKKR